MNAPNPPYVPLSQAAWYRRGLRASAALPAVILAATFIGIGSVCADYGMPLAWALLATLLIWAGPAHLILVGGLGSGASWVALALTVGLSSVRLLPMVVSLLPYLRLKDRHPLIAALCAHMVAISIWVEGLRLLPQVDAEGRVPFFLGLGTGLLASIGALGPFIGLFGTVFGIMNSFLAIAATKTTNLAVVAPGIAEALLATAIGLAAAIPAVLIYNLLGRRIAAFRLRLGDLATTVETQQSRELDRLTAPPLRRPTLAAE